MKKIYILLSVLGIAGIIVSVCLLKVKEQETLAIIFLICSLAILFISAIFECMTKKKEKANYLSQSKKDESDKNRNLELHATDDNVTKVIYKLYKGELIELSDLIKNSDCLVEYDYDEEENMYMVDFCSSDLSKKNKDAYIIVLYSSKDEKKLAYNDIEEDLMNLEENEIIEKLTKVLNEKVKRIEINELVIKPAKKQLIAYSIFISFSIALLITAIILGITRTIEWGVVFGLGLIGSIFIMLSGLGFYSYFHEKLIYQNHEFKYIGLFKKPVSCKVEDVKSVILEFTGSVHRFQFLDKNDNVLMKIRDDGTISNNKLFLVVLNKNNIKFDLFI